MIPPLQSPLLTKNNFTINDPSWIRWFSSPLTFTPTKRSFINASWAFSYNSAWTLVGTAGTGLIPYIPKKAKMIWGMIVLSNLSISSTISPPSLDLNAPIWFDLCPVAPGGLDAQGNSTDGNGRSSFQSFFNETYYTISQPFVIPIINPPETALYYRLTSSDPDLGPTSAPGGLVYMYISGYWI